MDDLWISPSILSLPCTIAERTLLARICQQVALSGGNCFDTNREMAQAIGMHHQTVSETIKRLSTDGLIQAVIVKSQANRRTIRPVEALIIDYKEFTDSLNNGVIALRRPYKYKAYSRKPADAPRETRLCPITGVDITHQRASSAVINKTTVKALLKRDQNRFDELVAQLLPSHMAGESYSTRCYMLALTARQLSKADQKK